MELEFFLHTWCCFCCLTNSAKSLLIITKYLINISSSVFLSILSTVNYQHQYVINFVAFIQWGMYYCIRVAMLQSWSNSLTFPDISSDYLRGIDPCNSSHKKRNACYFMTFLWQLCSSIYSNGITSAYTSCDAQLWLVNNSFFCTFCVKINTPGNWPYARTHFPWLILFPDFSGHFKWLLAGHWPLQQ